jgi:peroxiredoxin
LSLALEIDTFEVKNWKVENLVRVNAKMTTISQLIWACALAWFPGDGNPPTGAIHVRVADFHLKDTTGHLRSLGEYKGKRALVIVFIGTQCPIANAYVPTLADLHQHYAGKGVQFLAINANDQDTFADVRAHARERKIPFPVLKDAEHKAAQALGAVRTPEAFLLDSDRVIRYRGHIDNQYGYSYRRSAPTRTELKDAIEELLKGKSISVPQTEVQGCMIGKS